ncbi:glycoside hydrolase family 127 protein [Streptococcus rifensis]
MKAFRLNQVNITSEFWNYYLDLIRTETLPYQLAVLKDEIDVDVQAERQDASLPAGKSHAIENFKIAAGLSEGDLFGWFFQDSDAYKWLEAVGYQLQITEDFKLEAAADELIDIIAQAQEPTGYQNTYFQLRFPDLKYRQLYFSHELYCAGHLIEGAIAYHQATGKAKILDIVLRFVDNIAEHFGWGQGQIQGADGHQEIELALLKLYDYTGDEKCLELANFFLEIRGLDTDFYHKEIVRNLKDGLSSDNPPVDLIYLQAYTQPKYQEVALGHAVRMLYMSTAMAKLVQYLDNEELKEASHKIWEDITKHKMYITGGVGSTVHGEAFVGPYDLPNDTMYCETCASIALLYFAYELFKISPKGEYIDVMERVLYNGILSGAALDGKHFFYVNPLEVDIESCRFNPDKGHVKLERPDWLGCACCPPNFARTISSIGNYIYTPFEDSIYLNLYVASDLVTEDFELHQETAFPTGDSVSVFYKGMPKHLVLRKPYWATEFQVTCCGGDIMAETDDWVTVALSNEAEVKISFKQPLLTITANPLVQSTVGKVAFQKGPFVYCGQTLQNPCLDWCRIPKHFEGEYEATLATDLALSYPLVTIPALKVPAWEGLYRFNGDKEVTEPTPLHLMPYFLWANQGVTGMRVWFPKEVADD